jgi:hypothetical protein
MRLPTLEAELLVNIVAEQMIYGRVESVLSPRGSSGYQTVYHSPSLSASTVGEIQRVVGVFEFEDEPGEAVADVTRLQYFRIADGRVVLTKSVPAKDGELIDRNFRTKTFICHCLVISHADFQKVRCDPFAIMHSFHDRFIDTADDIKERFVDTPPPHNGRVEIPIVDYVSPLQLDWQNKQLSELRNAALLAKPVVDNGGSMAVIGTPDEVEKVLRAAFTMVEDPESRAGMTFTTNGDNCELVPGRFWAIGYCNRPRRDFPAVVDTAEKRVVKMPSGGGERGTTLFATWLESALQSTDGRPLAARIPTVRILAEAVDQGTKVSDTAVLDELAVEEFAEFGRDQLIDRLAKELAPSLDADLARILASWMANNHLYPSALVRASLFDIAQPKARLAEWLEKYLVALPSLAIRLKLTSWWSIRRFASSNQLPRLLFLANALAPWLVVAWWRRRNCRRALQELPHEEYRQLLEKTTPAVPPDLFVTGGKEPLLLRRCEELTLSDAELSSLLDSLIRYGEAFTLNDSFRKRIVELPRRSRRRLLRLVDKNPRHLKALEAPLLEADALTDRDASERLAFSRRLDGISGAVRRPDLDAQTQH